MLNEELKNELQRLSLDMQDYCETVEFIYENMYDCDKPENTACVMSSLYKLSDILVRKSDAQFQNITNK